MDPPSEASGEDSGVSFPYIEASERGSTEHKQIIMHTKNGNGITFHVDQYAFSPRRTWLLCLRRPTLEKLIIRESQPP